MSIDIGIMSLVHRRGYAKEVSGMLHTAIFLFMVH
jgi:hypothetical protein